MGVYVAAYSVVSIGVDDGGGLRFEGGDGIGHGEGFVGNGEICIRRYPFSIVPT